MNSVPETTDWTALGTAERNTYRVSDTCVDMRRPSRAPRAAAVGALPQKLLLDLSRAAIVVIDMQNDFCGPGGWIASLGIDIAPAAALIAPINQVTSRLRDLECPGRLAQLGRARRSAESFTGDPASLQPARPRPGARRRHQVSLAWSTGCCRAEAGGRRSSRGWSRGPKDIYVDKLLSDQRLLGYPARRRFCATWMSRRYCLPASTPTTVCSAPPHGRGISTASIRS